MYGKDIKTILGCADQLRQIQEHRGLPIVGKPSAMQKVGRGGSYPME